VYVYNDKHFYFREYSLDYMNPSICHEPLNKQLNTVTSIVN